MISENLMHVLYASTVFSTIVMTFIQKMKKLEIIRNKNHLSIINFLFSFILGIPFGILFYQLPLQESMWVGVFSFIGAPSIYDLLKKYEPTSFTKK